MHYKLHGEDTIIARNTQLTRVPSPVRLLLRLEVSVSMRQALNLLIFAQLLVLIIYNDLSMDDGRQKTQYKANIPTYFLSHALDRKKEFSSGA